MPKETRRSKIAKSNKQTAKTENANSFLSKTPVWQFCKNDKDHSKWSIRTCCNFNEDVMDKLNDFEGLTWNEIINTNGRDTNHYVYVNKFIKEAQSRLSELHIYDDQMFSLRLSGKKRLYGILDDGIFRIVWYDAEHEIYISKKKHT